MNRSESIAQIGAALSKAQSAIQPAIKDRVNPAFRSHYATLESIVDACRDALSRNDLAVIQSPVDAESADRVALETMLLHKSGEWVSSRVSCRLSKPDAQGLGSALTYLRRYALAGMVGVTATEDDDGNAASHEQPARQTVAAPQPARPATSAPRITPTMAQGETVAWTGTLAYVKSEQRTSKAGREYTSTRIGWTGEDGTKFYGTTFSETDGAFANRAKTQGLPVRLTYRVTDRGTDVVTIDAAEQVSAVEQMGGDDVIPF